jgi:hypothetical protein
LDVWSPARLTNGIRNQALGFALVHGPNLTTSAQRLPVPSNVTSGI